MQSIILGSRDTNCYHGSSPWLNLKPSINCMKKVLVHFHVPRFSMKFEKVLFHNLGIESNDIID